MCVCSVIVSDIRLKGKVPLSNILTCFHNYSLTNTQLRHKQGIIDVNQSLFAGCIAST